jgi:hypothetical protein
MTSPLTTFGQDVDFLKKNIEVIVLSDAARQAQVAISPAYQGRVMTSTATGTEGESFGWINKELIASGKTGPHMNAYGGEERFWIAPEGGQYSIYFAKGAAFDFNNWQVPAVIDTEQFDLISKSNDKAIFRKKTKLTNWTGTSFEIQIDRTIRLLDNNEAAKDLATEIGKDVSMVAYETDSKVTNTGKDGWKKETGLLSIWILSMLKPTPDTAIVIPFEAGPEEKLGPIVNDDYFGKVPAERLIVKDDVLFFKGDGKFRSKIGLPVKRAKSILGSYDASNKVLTIVQYKKPKEAKDYVNNAWKIQNNPYEGDVVNSYNDGSLEGGAKQLGPFYELETLSPALALEPGQSGTHIHRIFHFKGPQSELDKIAAATLGVTIAEIEKGF